MMILIEVPFLYLTVDVPAAPLLRTPSRGTSFHR